jgi:hypothetical protein
MVLAFDIEMRLCEKLELLAHEFDSLSMRTIYVHNIRFHDFLVAIVYFPNEIIDDGSLSSAVRSVKNNVWYFL